MHLDRLTAGLFALNRLFIQLFVHAILCIATLMLTSNDIRKESINEKDIFFLGIDTLSKEKQRYFNKESDFGSLNNTYYISILFHQTHVPFQQVLSENVYTWLELPHEYFPPIYCLNPRFIRRVLPYLSSDFCFVISFNTIFTPLPFIYHCVTLYFSWWTGFARVTWYP